MTRIEMRNADFWFTMYLLDSFENGFHEAYLRVWDRQRAARGIPSIFD